MAGKGGARPGAGRKPKGIKRATYASPIQHAEAKISERLPWLVDKLFELAEGVEVERRNRQGQTRIYSEGPDREAIKYLMDRVMGKPTQPIDVTHEVEQIAADYGVEPERVTSIVERLRQKRTG